VNAPTCLVVGFGSWGQRVYDKLLGLGVEVASVDPYHPCADAADAGELDFYRVTHAVVAVPPSKHREVALRLLEMLPALTDLRLEKPGCESEDELLDVVAAADARDVQVSVGYTLAGSELYRWVVDHLPGVVGVQAVRHSNRPPRHEVSELLDLGAHAAFVAVWLGAGEFQVSCRHDAGMDSRVATLRLEDGTHATVLEHSETIILPDGARLQVDAGDALRRELDAFLEGAPLVGSESAVDAHRLMASQAVGV